MNFSNLKYKSLLVGAGACMLLATSCKDFLDIDLYDQYSTTCLNTKEAYESLTAPLYGGYVWSQYEGKFAWCVNEGIPGVLFNVNDQEGALFKLSIGEDNTILKEGYTSLYSGVIATSNQVIKTVADSAAANSVPAGMTMGELYAVMGEAYLFRAYAHFLATEYFGECPLVLNTAADIANDVAVPRVSRRTLYAQIEKDLKTAFACLPQTRTADTWRATKYSAAALLGKLYLTMGSCRANTPGLTYPYICPNADAMLDSAKVYLDYVVANKELKLIPHSELFNGATRNDPSAETIFALYWRLSSQYGEGSQYQSQMAPNGDWSKGSGWGSGKGLTYTLYNSFEESDPRKKELCFYVGEGEGMGYTTVDGRKAWYGSAYSAKKKSGEVQFGQDGKEFLSQGQHLLNNIKKYVWGVDGSVHSTGMSTDRRQDIIRLSDVYMMLAEVAYLKSNAPLSTPNTDATVLSYVNEVLSAHGATPLTSMAYCEDFSDKHKVGEKFDFNVTVDDGNGAGVQKTISVFTTVQMFHGEKRQDYMQQRRKEFAMEGYAWLDLKRLYYLDPDLANKFLVQMDRGCQFTNSPEIPEGDGRFQNETGYKRLALVNQCNDTLKTKYPNGNYTVGDDEVKIFVEDFIAKNRWYLPIPASAKGFLQAGVQDLYDQVMSNTYPY